MCRICTKAIESKPPAADDLPLTGLAFERRLRRANCGGASSNGFNTGTVIDPTPYLKLTGADF